MKQNAKQSTTLLTSHKGVDLHAATALLVMKDRLEGGAGLVNLLRCEVHSFAGAPDGWTAERLLQTGVYFNPNKHHYGLFKGSALDIEEGSVRISDWLDTVIATDLEIDSDSAEVNSGSLAESLLGGIVPAGCSSYDVVSHHSGQSGPVVSGVLWRLVIRGDEAVAQEVGLSLAVAQGRKQGLLINPHMESWQTVGR